jgi:hypothetical protein
MMQQNLAETAFSNIFPEEEARHIFRVVYTGRVKDYGASASLSSGVMTFKLSRKWESISDEIQMGLIQELMLKLMKRKRQSMYIDLYNNFVRHLHIAIPKDHTEPQIEESFDRVNEKYFLGLVEKPNLRWGQFSTRTFGSYDFKTDMITISTVFKDVEDTKYIDYIMFHEMLHKQRKFFKSGTKTYYHDARFKRLESVYEDAKKVEGELSTVVAKERAKAFFRQKTERRKESFPKRRKGFFGWLRSDF